MTRPAPSEFQGDDDIDAPAEEPSAGSVARTTQKVAPSSRRESIRTLSRHLKEEDLNSAGTQRLILEDWERAEARCEELEEVVDRFHVADKRAAVLEARIAGLTKVDTLFGVCLAIGGALFGMSTSIGWVGGLAGVALCAAGVFVRVRE